MAKFPSNFLNFLLPPQVIGLIFTRLNLDFNILLKKLYFSFMCSNFISICFCVLFSFKIFIYWLLSTFTIHILLKCLYFSNTELLFSFTDPEKLFFTFKMMSFCFYGHIFFFLFSLALFSCPLL